MTRYVMLQGDGMTQAQAFELQRKTTPGDGFKVFPLGPEVKEPDYGPLVEWVSVAPHGNGCRWQHNSRCDCGLTDALKAARIE